MRMLSAVLGTELKTSATQQIRQLGGGRRTERVDAKLAMTFVPSPTTGDRVSSMLQAAALDSPDLRAVASPSHKCFAWVEVRKMDRNVSCFLALSCVSTVCVRRWSEGASSCAPS